MSYTAKEEIESDELERVQQHKKSTDDNYNHNHSHSHNGSHSSSHSNSHSYPESQHHSHSSGSGNHLSPAHHYQSTNHSQSSVTPHRRSSRYDLPDKKFRVEFQIPEKYDFSRSTEENYQQPNSHFVGKYAKERSQLDYSFHVTYTEERQLFHDQLIDKFHKTIVHDAVHDWYCESPLENWIVFTAGVMGAGKGHTMEWLDHQGLFPKDAFVNVDPDAIRYLLPEFESYNKIDNTQTGYLTQKEVGYISEVLTYHALQGGKNVLIDGSLRDAPWYLEYFRNLRDTFPKVKLAIIHVDAPLNAIIQRCNIRAKVTGRIVPPELIKETAEALPVSLSILRPKVEFFARIMNDNHNEKHLEYAEMKKKHVSLLLDDGVRRKEEGFQYLWRLVQHPHTNNYTYIDDERKEERIIDGWRMIFSDVWTMTCEIPISWIPAAEEFKK